VRGRNAAQLDPPGDDAAVSVVDCCPKRDVSAFQHLKVVARATDIDSHAHPPDVVERPVSDRQPVATDLDDRRPLRPALAHVAALEVPGEHDERVLVEHLAFVDVPQRPVD
jgi:hypothetical protein